MGILKRENWWAWLLLGIASSGISIFFLGALLEVYRKDEWYAKWYYWALGIIILLLPAIIMFFIFYIQTLANICKKLEVPGSEIYAYPYAYIICFIVPIIGWVLLAVLLIYIHIWYLVKLYQGKGEKWIKN